MKKIKTEQKQANDVRLVSSDTPWGRAQSAEEIGPGIFKYSTASHGGYFLNVVANARVSPIFKRATFCQQGLKGWYEEDCDWAIVVYTFREHFTAKHYSAAVKSLKSHFEEAWQKLHKK